MMDSEQKKRNQELIKKSKEYKKDWVQYGGIFLIIAIIVILYFLFLR